MTILGDSVGANGCSPEEEVLSHAQGRRQKVVGTLRDGTLRDSVIYIRVI